MSSLRIVTLIAAALLSAPAIAQEATPEERARVLYENGSILYEEGAYEGAIVAFQKAYELSGKLELQYNIANCLERLGRWAEARDALNLYRAVAPVEERDRLLRRLESLEQRIRAAEAAPVPTPAVVTPPEPQVTEPAPPVELTPSKQRPMWPVLGAGLGTVALGGGMAIGGWAASRGALEAGNEQAWAVDRGVNNAGLAIGGVGVILTVVGAVIPVRTGLTVVPTPGGVLFQVRH